MPPAVDGIKIFDSDDQTAKHYCCLLTGGWVSSLFTFYCTIGPH